MQPLDLPTPSSLVGWYMGSIGFALTFTQIHNTIRHWRGRSKQCRMCHILFSTQFCSVTFIFYVCKYSVVHVEDLTLAKRISGSFICRGYSRPSGISHINLFRQTKYFRCSSFYTPHEALFLRTNYILYWFYVLNVLRLLTLHSYVRI